MRVWCGVALGVFKKRGFGEHEYLKNILDEILFL